LQADLGVDQDFLRDRHAVDGELDVERHIALDHRERDRAEFVVACGGADEADDLVALEQIRADRREPVLGAVQMQQGQAARLDIAGVTAAVVLSDKLFRLSTSGGNIDALLAGVILTGFLLVDPFMKGRIQPRPVLAGLLLGAAVAIKPTAVLLVLVVLVVHRGFRALVATGVTAAALTALGFLVVTDSGGFFRSALPWLKAGQPTVLVQRIGLGDALRSIGTPSSFLNPFVIGLQAVLLLVLILVLGPWGQRRNHTVGREVEHSWFWLAVGLGTCACVVVTPYAFEVYAVYTCIAVAVLLGRWFTLSELSRLVLVLAILAGHSPVSWRSAHHAVDMSGRFGVLVSVLLLAGLLVAQATSERRSARALAVPSGAGSRPPVNPATVSVGLGDGP
jgi:hypothetical protein